MKFVNNPWIYLSEVILHSPTLTARSEDTPHSAEENNHSNLKISTVAVCAAHDNIAIATTDGNITVYLKKERRQIGRTTEKGFVTKTLLGCENNHDPYFTQLSWQGGRSCTNLAAGRNDGQIVYIDVLRTKSLETDRTDELIELDSKQDIHQHEIVGFKWNKNDDSTASNHLLSVDRTGCCCLWKTELNVALIPVTKYHNDNQISAISFVDSLFPMNDFHHHFLFGLYNGNLYHANELGQCNQISLEEECDRIEAIECYKKDVILITRSSQLIQMKVVDGLIVQTKKAKINLDLDFANKVLLGSNGKLLCITKGTVHCFDLENNENYEIKQPGCGDQNDDGNMTKPTSMAIASSGNFLCVNLSNGKCIFWNCDVGTGRWVLSGIETPMKISIQDRQTLCAFARDTICLHNDSHLTLYVQECAKSAFSHEIFALQTGPTTIDMFNKNDMEAFVNLDTGMNINGIAVDALMLCVWSNEEVHLYKVDLSGYFHLHLEMCIKVQSVALSEDSLFLAKDNSLVITDLFGVQRLKINLAQKEDSILHLQCLNDVLTIVTRLGTLKTLDVSQKEPKLFYVKDKIFRDLDCIDCPRKIISMRSNSDGTLVSMVSEISGKHKMKFCFMKNGTIIEADTIVTGDNLIMWHSWDSAFSNLFACEIRGNHGDQNHLMIVFVSQENMYIHEKIPLQRWSQCVGISAPSMRFVSKLKSSSDLILRHGYIEGFEGIDPSDVDTISTMVDFFFHLNRGCLEKAYVAIQSNQHGHLAWHKLAQASVTFGRIDIAERCLIKLGNGMGVASVRKASKDVALAEVAVQLGMYEEAERLYRAANKLELLCELKRRQGLHADAAQINDGLCIRTMKLNIQIANQAQYDHHLTNFSNSHRVIGQSLASKKVIAANMIKANEPVESFLKNENNVDLYKWYAQYLESRGFLDRAKQIYTAVDDSLSLVRIACLEGDLSSAFSYVKCSESSAGAYYLARHLEANGDIKEAVDCLCRSRKYHYAIRLSKSLGMHNELVHIASKCEASKAVECANYLERLGYQQMAAEIYLAIHSHGNALKLIATLPLDKNTARLKAEVLSIADTLNFDESMDAVRNCAKIMLRSGMYNNAITLLQRRGLDADNVVKLCSESDVIFNEDLINEMNVYFKQSMDKASFLAIAALCKAQGNFILACKMYTRGGNRSSAIKCLLQTSDTNKIISYAFKSRNREVYIMVANHIQKLDYYHNEDIKRALLQLYTKAKSNQHLVRLMISWSSFEATDGEYEIALKWLMEAKKYSMGNEDKAIISEEEHRWIQKNLDALQLFQMAQKLAFTDRSHTNEVCTRIISSHENSDLIQIGDCYALLVQIQVHSKDAHKIIKEMRRQGLSPLDYIEDKVIKQIELNGDSTDARDSSV